jgi:hypothetical protein
MVYLTEVGVGLTSSFVYDFLKTIYSRAIGKKAPDKIEELESEGQLHSGDMAAIEDAAMPSIKRAHTIANNGANNVFIFSGQHTVVHFDSASKRHVQSSLRNNELRSKIVSVPSYNANSRYGRVFDLDQQKTVPIEADGPTIATITGSIADYALAKRADRIKSAVAIQYTSIDSIDGKIKKLIIHKARKELSHLSRER